MERLAKLFDQLYFTNSTLAKSKIIRQYLAETPDPDRGWAIAAMAGTLKFDLFKRNLVKELITERIDPELFELSYDYVGEMSETVAHLWPHNAQTDVALPSLTEVVETFQQATKQQTRDYLVSLLDQMTAPQRWALLKLGTRGLRIGVSARLLKKVLAEYGNVEVEEVERVWHGLTPPYVDLFAWLEGQAEKPDVSQQLVYQPVMLAHPLDETDMAKINSSEWAAEWKYDGIRVQIAANQSGKALYSRTGDDISHSFPDFLETIDFHAVLDGELLIMHEGQVGSFNQLQQRLNKKKPSKKLMAEFPVGIVLYDALSLESESLLSLPFQARRERLQEWYKAKASTSLQLSELLSFSDILSLTDLKMQAQNGEDRAIEGLMLKRLDSAYMAGRPKNQWFKWKRDPLLVDAVIMYAQRGHGKRSSFYSDFTFGAWQDEQLLPIGKAYSGFTDQELKELDRWVRNNTIERFGPVKEVEKSLVVEVAFDSVHESKRHKSGVALRFPRIKRIRWDKPAQEADVLDSVKNLIK